MKLYKILSLLILLSSVFFSCTDEDNMELNKGNTPLEISVSDETLEIDAANPGTEALLFTWTSGSNMGTGAAIDYTFQLDVQGNNFANGISLDMGRGIYEKSYKNEELNELLINEFGIAPEMEVIMEARIVATFGSDKLQPETSNVKVITIKTHKPITKTLYLIGDATPNGWSADEATEMKPISNVAKGFSWTGALSAGKFKFITTLGEFTPSYNKGADDTKLYFRENGSDPYDEQFEITEGGTYTIKVNLISMAISIEKGEGPEYTQLWLVGHSTGWSFKPMTVDILDPFVFHYNDELAEGGEFKIGTADGSWDAIFFRPITDKTAEGTDLEVDKWAGDPDYKWDITGGVYKIKLDTREMKIDIVPFTPYPTVYLIGDATSAGWTLDNALPMAATADPYKLEWTGSLNAGELKFTCDKQSDWNGDWFNASEADKAPAGEEEQMIFRLKGTGPDNKWIISAAGTYSIVLDQLKETVIIKKQ